MFHGLSCVERNGDAAEAQDRQICDGPLWSIFRHQGDAILSPDAGINQAQCDMPYASNELRRRDVNPLFSSLLIDRVGLVVPKDSFQTHQRQGGGTVPTPFVGRDFYGCSRGHPGKYLLRLGRLAQISQAFREVQVTDYLLRYERYNRTKAILGAP